MVLFLISTAKTIIKTCCLYSKLPRHYALGDSITLKKNTGRLGLLFKSFGTGKVTLPLIVNIMMAVYQKVGYTTTCIIRKLE